jgi:hypothetical protein
MLCATVDIASEFGRLIFAREDVPLSRLRGGPVSIRLAFHTRGPTHKDTRAMTRWLDPDAISVTVKMLQ